MSILDNQEENKNFLSKFALFLLSISIIGCIIAIIDYHSDLHTDSGKGSQSFEFSIFLYYFNLIIIFGNMTYVGFSIHRYLKFTKEKNKEILQRTLYKKLS